MNFDDMNFDNIIQRCLDEIAAGRKTARECAEQYPHVPGLLEQLRAAEALRGWTRPELSDAAALRHQGELRAALAAQRSAAPQRAFWPRWAFAAVLVAVLTLSAAGTVSASASSLPGQPLYSVKRVTETVRGALLPAGAKAAWHTTLAAERTAELQALGDDPTSDLALVVQTATDMQQETALALADVAQADAPDQAELLQTLLRQIGNQVEVLNRVQAQVPAQAQPFVAQALATSVAHQAAARDRVKAHGHHGPTATTSAGAVAPTRTPRPPTATVVRPSQAQHHASPTPALATTVPPGQARKTATPETTLPPGQARKTATPETTTVPPGQERKTATAAALPGSPTPPGSSGEQGPANSPNCRPNNPYSPNYCTPVSPSFSATTPEARLTTGASGPTSTACPVNAAGKPVCAPRP
jgi:hypothetical protein